MIGDERTENAVKPNYFPNIDVCYLRSYKICYQGYEMSLFRQVINHN